MTSQMLDASVDESGSWERRDFQSGSQRPVLREGRVQSLASEPAHHALNFATIRLLTDHTILLNHHLSRTVATLHVMRTGLRAPHIHARPYVAMLRL